MIDDRNKTELTKTVTALAIAYLDERGCKPIETEVWVCREPCWIADVAGMICPTQTEMIKLKLVKSKPAYTSPRFKSWQAEIANLYRTMSVMVEVKTTRADFRGDKKWTRPIPTDLAYLAIHRGIVRPDEFPEGWGILEHHDGAIRLLRAPTPRETAIQERFHVCLQVALRRDHASRYERFRAFARQERIEQQASKSRITMNKAIDAVCAITQGEHESIERALEVHGIKDVDRWTMEALQGLWAIKSA